MHRLIVSSALLPLLVACSSEPQLKTSSPPVSHSAFLRPSGSLTPRFSESVLDYQNTTLRGDFADNWRARQFIDRMVAEHHFQRAQLNLLFSQARRLDNVLRLMDRQAPTRPATGPNGAWLRYRKKFLTPDTIENGVLFWQENAGTLQRAWRQYGVPPEIIIGIMGVETRWGRNTGNTRTLDALATLAFDYPRRAAYFTQELEHFLLASRQQHYNPLNVKGSFAGALGFSQFMPSSLRRYAVDFDGDGRIDLWNPADAIGSIAHYFQAHGWQRGGVVAVRAAGEAPTLRSGFNTRYSLATLQAAGLRPLGSLQNYRQASLLKLDVGSGYQYWYGLPNFYVITRYNHSVHYAMAVWQLGEAVKQARATSTY